MFRGHGLDSAGLGYEPAASSCENGKEHLGSKNKGGNFLSS
jgi:hypothetical protein